MPWDDGLAGISRNIAATEDTPLRVMAGPGTGKTFAMKRRVARLLEEGQNARRVLAVTFTRTAAADLVRELRGLDVPGCENIRAGTLHAFCFSVLAQREVLENLGRYPRPVVMFAKSGVLQFEGAPLLEDLDNPDDFGTKRDRTKRIRAFEAAWARLQQEEPGWPADPVDRAFQDALLGWLRFHSAMLIGELIPETLRYLRNNPAAPELTAFDNVIVDEYQDLNRAEQELLDTLAANSAFAVVGDEDQSIYSFRHAHPEGIIEFADVHNPTHDEELVECRRCPRLVVRLADHLIRANHAANASARLRPLPTNPEGEVRIVQWPSVDSEAAGLAAYIAQLIERRGNSLGDILILTPRRLIGYGIRDALIARDIATHSFYHEEALESDFAQRAFSLLGLAAANNDRVALRFWLGLGSPSWNAGEYRRLRAYCEAEGEDLYDALNAMEEGRLRIGGTTRIVRRFTELKDELNAVQNLTGIALLDYLFPDDEQDAQLMRDAAILAGAVDRNMNAAQLRDVLTTYITQPEMPEAGQYVRIMSLHKSKGLTSKVVIIAGCNEGLIPTIDYELPLEEQERTLKEQRRLFYVAITRPKEVLCISSFTSIESRIAFQIGARFRGRGRLVQTLASRFIDELGPDAPAPLSGGVWQQNGFR